MKNRLVIAVAMVSTLSACKVLPSEEVHLFREKFCPAEELKRYNPSALAPLDMVKIIATGDRGEIESVPGYQYDVTEITSLERYACDITDVFYVKAPDRDDGFIRIQSFNHKDIERLPKLK